MSWLERLTPPGLTKVLGTKKAETPDNLWIKCPKSGEMLFREDLEKSHWVTPAGYHFRISPKARFDHLFDNAKYEEIETPEVKLDPLKFRDSKTYVERIRAARAKTGDKDAMAIALGKIGGQQTVVIVQNFAFLGGSLGMAAGEAFVKAADLAIEQSVPLVMVSSSGGARMQNPCFPSCKCPAPCWR